MAAKSFNMNHNSVDNWFSWMCGVVGGCLHYQFLEIHIYEADWIALARATITALICGFAGMVGKTIYNKIFKNKS